MINFFLTLIFLSQILILDQENSNLLYTNVFTYLLSIHTIFFKNFATFTALTVHYNIVTFKNIFSSKIHMLFFSQVVRHTKYNKLNSDHD